MHLLTQAVSEGWVDRDELGAEDKERHRILLQMQIQKGTETLLHMQILNGSFQTLSLFSLCTFNAQETCG